MKRSLSLPWLLVLAACAPPVSSQLSEELVQAYLWPRSSAELEDAEQRLRSNPSLESMSRSQMLELQGWMRGGRPTDRYPGVGPIDAVHAFDVDSPGGRTIPVFVWLPTRYTPETEWPLMLAMHGGPPGSAQGAVGSAARIIDVWVEAAEEFGWIVVSPAMVSTVAREGRSQDRLPYEIFHQEEARAVIDAVRDRYHVDPDRIVSTGISLGSNFSIGFGAAHPDWFSAIVPVSTEGDSRELLLRNLQSVPTYVLEGSQDQNIRGVSGPRSLNTILTSFGYDLLYREFGDRAHEGFGEHYPDVLRWLESRPREHDPEEVIRVPHEGIMPVSRRVHWIETDTRQGVVRARTTSPTEIEISVRWAGELTLYLNDQIVDMDRNLTIHVNGESVLEGPVQRSARVALEEARRLGDPQRVYSARLTVTVPRGTEAVARGRELWESLTPTHPEGPLSFWEIYAARALEERFPSVGFGGEEVALPAGVSPRAPEQVALQVTSVEEGSPAAKAGLLTSDLLVSVGGEPFFEGRGGAALLHRLMMRELRETPADYAMVVWRDQQEVTLRAILALGPYLPPSGP